MNDRLGREASGIITFAERLLALLDQGSFVATYKYSVLLALMDLCLEGTRRDGTAPDCITTRQLAEKVLELYWPQTAVFRGRTLRQNAGHQARILTDIKRFRDALADPSASLSRARLAAASAFERLVRRVEWTLILMPLPRLQTVGGAYAPVLYQIGWGLDIERNRRAVAEYQRTGGGGFDNRILLYPSVGDHLVALNGLLRPLVHRGWSAMVAQLNALDESKLEDFLFGGDRVALRSVAPHLVDLQGGRCFYCGDRVGRAAEVDHFIPWSRYPDNGIENLVAADRRCNADKRDFLAASDHVGRWVDRNRRHQDVLAQIVLERRWETHPAETLGVARALYLRLGPDVPLWVTRKTFRPPDAKLHGYLG